LGTAGPLSGFSGFAAAPISCPEFGWRQPLRTGKGEMMATIRRLTLMVLAAVGVLASSVAAEHAHALDGVVANHCEPVRVG